MTIRWSRRGAVWASAFLNLLVFLPAAWADSVSEHKAAFRKADGELNEVYRELRGALESWDFEKVKAEQIDWLEYRDHRAKAAAAFDAGAEEGEEEATAVYWEFMASLTEERLRMLRGWKDKDTFKGWDGEWIDGRGGVLRTVEKDGALFFILQVVRGPTYHLGSIAGKAEMNGALARFTDKGRDDEKISDDGETWLDFKLAAPHLEIRGANTWHYHGARAYFDGTYLRVGRLTAKEAARVLAGEVEEEY